MKKIIIRYLAVAALGCCITGVWGKAAYSKESDGRKWLGHTLEYCDGLEKDKYTQESWENLQTACQKAEGVYKSKSGSEACNKQRMKVEIAKSQLVYAESGGETEETQEFQELSAEDITAQMGVGWNLGNTMDGHENMNPSETEWQSVVTTQEFIKYVHDCGFQTLRIPVTWGNMIDDRNGYQIDEEWLARVKEIVDYGIHEGMYVIINIHHDGADGTYWLTPYAEDIDAVYEKFGGVWRNIATYFMDYDEHLIFESMNEVYGDSDSIYCFNQIFVNEVRATGGNNGKRWLSIPGSGANIGAAQLDFPFPKDTMKDRLFFAFHYYDWSFGLEESMDTTVFEQSNALQLDKQFEWLQKCFTSRGIPVILGEFGCIDKKNPVERTYFDEVSTRICKNYDIVPV